MVIREIIKSYQADVAEIVQGINELFKGKKLHEKIEMMGSYEDEIRYFEEGFMVMLA